MPIWNSSVSSPTISFVESLRAREHVLLEAALALEAELAHTLVEQRDREKPRLEAL